MVINWYVGTSCKNYSTWLCLRRVIFFVFSHANTNVNIFCFINPLTLNVENNAPEFIVHLCMDILLEVLGFGKRRRLIKLERIGQRYHRIIEHFFKEAPSIWISPRFEEFRLVFWHSFTLLNRHFNYFIMPCEFNACLQYFLTHKHA